MATIALAGCSDSDTQDTDSGTMSDNGDNEDNSASNDPAVTILDHELVETDLDFAEVAGTLQNTSGQDQPYIEVSVIFYDSTDTRIGTTMWNTEDVSPGQEVKFQTVMSTLEYDEVESYEVETATESF